MDRFATFAAEEKARRAASRAALAASDARRGAAAVARERGVHERDASSAAAELARQAALRVDGAKARRNRPSQPFDFLTQSYAASPAGAALRAADEARAAARTAAGLVGFAYRSNGNPLAWDDGSGSGGGGGGGRRV